tara:strand:+ start:147 stop:1592 length:1446 start_codon:yes stop_codon:yes gene_type:complete
MEVLQRTANRGSISTGYDIDNSLKFERSGGGEHVRTSDQAVGNKKTWTFSAWLKRTQLGQDYSCVFGSGYTNIQFMDNDKLRVVLYDGSNSRYADTDQVFRDTSAFYHIVIALDSTQGTASDRVKIYINGVRVTSFSNTTYTNMSQNDEFGLGYAGSDGSERWLRLGDFFGGSEGFSGYMSDVYYLNGTAEDADAFGEFDGDSGIWIPKKYTGSGFGTQGFKYEFKDSSALGTDTSGEGHDANGLNNISAADQATDTPTNNFATFNTLYNYDGVVINEGATKTTNENTANFRSVVSNIAVQNGKWYAEFTAGSNTGFVGVGLVEEMTGSLPKSQYLGQLGESISYYAYQGQILHGGSAQSTTGTFAGYGAGDVIGIALDKTNGFVYWHKNGTYQNSGDPTSGATGTGGIALSLGYSGYAQSDYYFMGYAQSSATTAYANFGGYTADTPSSPASDANGYGTFEYAPPTGYYALCSRNLSEFG